MQLSYYTIVLYNVPKEGEYLLFNTRTQALVKIDQALKNVIDHYADPALFAQRCRFSEELAALHDMGLIVASEEEDLAKIEDFFEQMKTVEAGEVFTVNLLTTYACNFRCAYCFEENTRSSEYLDLVTGDMVMRWLKNRMKQRGYRKLSLVFYGGEPLLNRPAVEYIARHMQQWCQRENREFSFMLQTNGYLLTPDILEELLTLGLNYVRISLDGVGADHDRRRPLRSGGGTFARIMENIKANADRVKIGLSVSYDKADVRHIGRLLDYLDEEGLLPRLGRFIFAPVHAGLGSLNSPECIQNAECLSNFRDGIMVEARRAINRLLDTKGMRSTDSLLASACPLTRKHGGVTIDQRGRIYKCNSMLGHPQFCVGDVCFEEFNHLDQAFRDLEVWRKCPLDCAYLPVCAGGCRLASYLNYQDFSVPVCHKAFLDAMAPEFIQRDYRSLRGEIK